MLMEILICLTIALIVINLIDFNYFKLTLSLSGLLVVIIYGWIGAGCCYPVKKNV